LPDLSQRLQDALAGRYTIERELGRGGMATVFLARDLKHQRRVALKVLEPEVARAIGPERFLREIETAARLSHPHILPLFDSGQADGLLFYAMPYVEGESLRERLERDKQLPLEEALRLTREIASALDYAHRQGIVHRDIKPENVLLQEGQALVADFGIARAAAAGGAKLTATGVAVGTPAYMSPEQAAGGAVDARADVYALGCVLYELLAGQAPYLGPTAESVIFQHLNAAVPRITALRPALPAGLDRVIGKALAKSPADRYGSVAEFLAGLETGLSETEPEKPATHRVLWSSVVVVAGLAGLLLLSWWQAWGPFGGTLKPAAKKDWILVADFDGPPGDSTLAPAARGLLSAALDQSRIVATVTNDQISEALQTAGKPPDTRLTPALAKELAYRSAVRTVLEGTIGKLGTGYSVIVRLTDADSARVLFTESATARGDDALIPAMGELAKKVRRGLGENRRSLAATRPLVQVATPSFEAYRLFVQAGLRFNVHTELRERLRACRSALAVDSAFASARLWMVFPYMILAYPDSAQTCLDAALRHPDRLTPVERGLAEVAMASVHGDFEGGVAACDRVLAIDPGNLQALIYSCQDLGALGRYEEGLERVHRMKALSPFGPIEPMRHLETGFLTELRRFDEARAANARMTGIWKPPLRINIEMASGRFAVAESISRANLSDTRVQADIPGLYLADFGMSRFGRGAVREAVEAHQQVREIVRQRNDPVFMAYFPRFFTELSVLSGITPLPPIPTERDSSEVAVLTRGLVAVARGDRAVARRCLENLRRRPARELAFDLTDVPLLEARLAALAGRPEDAVRLLRPFDRNRYQRQGVSLAWVHWWLADAFEQKAQPDSAAWYLERLERTSIPGPYAPYVHRRLALLDVKLGRVADAERNLAVTERLWDQPDPTVRRMLDEARTAVHATRALSPPKR
jgi:serine/threonine protein kinase